MCNNYTKNMTSNTSKVLFMNEILSFSDRWKLMDLHLVIGDNHKWTHLYFCSTDAKFNALCMQILKELQNHYQLSRRLL